MHSELKKALDKKEKNIENMMEATIGLYRACREIAHSEPMYVDFIKPLDNALDHNYLPTPTMFKVLIAMADHPKIKKTIAHFDDIYN